MKYIFLAVTLLLGFTVTSHANPSLNENKINLMMASLSTFDEVKQKFPQSFGSDIIQLAGTCFKSGEKVSGMKKICYYKCISGESAITIKSYELCPLIITD